MKNIITIIIFYSSLFLFSQVGINTEKVTDGISLEVNGNMRIATTQAATGFGKNGADYVLTRDANGIVQKRKFSYKAVFIKNKTYTLNLVTPFAGGSVVNQSFIAATTNTFTLDQASNYTEDLWIYGLLYKNISGPALQFTTEFTVNLKNASTNNLIASHTNRSSGWTVATQGGSSFNSYITVPNLPAGDYYLELVITKYGNASGGEIELDLSGLTMKSNYSYQKIIDL